MRTLSKDWWVRRKTDYIFDPQWFEVFKSIDPCLTIPSPCPDGQPCLGKLGVVFWHEPDGQTIIPVGITHREGDKFTFCYHPDYASDPSTKPISVTLPKSTLIYRYTSAESLLPYFDNVVSEGALGMAQRNACHLRDGKQDVLHETTDFVKTDSAEERYQRMLLFGRGFHGAVSVVDAVAPDRILHQEQKEVKQMLRSQATVGGAQAKMLAVPTNSHFRTAARDDASTHIAKLPASYWANIIEDEYLCTKATEALLPGDPTVEISISRLDDSDAKALLIKRFDRTPQGGRVHFEEALQIRNAPSRSKEGLPYRDLADITRRLMGDAGVRLLFKRVLAQFLLGTQTDILRILLFSNKPTTHGNLPLIMI